MIACADKVIVLAGWIIIVESYVYLYGFVHGHTNTGPPSQKCHYRAKSHRNPGKYFRIIA